jgi:hypothetical protein
MRLAPVFWLTLAAFAGSACKTTQWPSGARAYRQPPATITPVALERARYRYEARTVDAPLQASGIDVVFVDPRPGGDILPTTEPALMRGRAGLRTDVPLPASVAQAASERLTALVAGTGPALRLQARVPQLFVTLEGERRAIVVMVEWSLTDAAGALLVSEMSEYALTLTGPPHDRAELDDMHVGVFLSALDEFIANAHVIELVNLKLAAALPATQI